MLEHLQRGLRRRPTDQIYLIQGLLDLADLHELVRDRPARPEGRALVPAHTSALRRRRPTRDDLFAEIRRGDILVHHPYDSFATSFEAFVRAAAAAIPTSSR